MYLQLGYGGTPTWITSGYNWLGPSMNSSSSSVTKISQAGATANGFYPKYYTSTSGYGASVVDITGFANGIAQSYTCIEFSYNGVGNYYTSTSGTVSNSNTITAIRLISASGTIASGTASLYLISQ